MKNNKGFAKFELLTIFVLIICIIAYFLYTLLGGVSSQKLEAFRDNAVSFRKAVSTNINTFRNTESIYLGEVIDEGFIGKIKNPFGEGYCSLSDSKVQYIDNVYYVTLQCGNYLIDRVTSIESAKIDYYEVSDWSLEKTSDNDEEKVLYNCLDNGKEMYSEYYEDLYLVSLINKDFGTDYYHKDTINECELVSKTFYRSKNLLEK